MDTETSEVYKIANSKCKLGKRVLHIYYTSPNLLFSNDYRMRLKSRRKIGGYIARLVQRLGCEREDRKARSSTTVVER
jgi:hypothetical protein